jgi:hypothetical protein
MSESDQIEVHHRWGALSVAMLAFGLLIVVFAGIWVGEIVYDRYLSSATPRFPGDLAAFGLIVGTPLLAFGLLVVYAAFRSRIDPDDE